MSATVAIIAATSASNSAAIAAADRAQDTACQAVIQGFNAQTANTQAQIAYADCVHRLNPQPITGDGKLIVASLMLVLIAGFLFGALNGRYGSDTLFDRFMFGLFGMLIAFVAWLLGAGLIAGLMLLFS
jgi:hypothetical protein